MAGGVQNLRALFEQNSNYTGPHERGSKANTADGRETPPKLLSKVRTSFVMVEKSGHASNQASLRRDVSGESTTLQRGFGAKGNKMSKESAAQATSTSKPVTKSTENKLDLKLNQNEHGLKRNTTAMNSLATVDSTVSSRYTNNTQLPASKQVNKASSKLSDNPASSLSARKGISSTSLTYTRKQAETRNPEKKMGRGTIAPAHSTPLVTKSLLPSLLVDEKAKTESSPSQSRLRPNHRSPTRPVKLPASLTTHTASSSSRSATVAPIIRSQSHGSTHGRTVILNRSHSQTNTASRAPSAMKGELYRNSPARRLSGELSRKPSGQNLVSQSAPAEDNFLARMMRPTTSSASKTAEKTASSSKQSRPTSRTLNRNGMREGSSKPETKKSPLVARKAKKEENAAKIEILFNPLGIENKKVSAAPIALILAEAQKSTEPVLARGTSIAKVETINSESVHNSPTPKSDTLKDVMVASAETSQSGPIEEEAIIEPLDVEPQPTNSETQPLSHDNYVSGVVAPNEVSDAAANSTITPINETKIQTPVKTEILDEKALIDESIENHMIPIPEIDMVESCPIAVKIRESSDPEFSIEQGNIEPLEASSSNLEIAEALVVKEPEEGIGSLQTSLESGATLEPMESQSSSTASPVSSFDEGPVESRPATSLLLPSSSQFESFHSESFRSPILMKSSMLEDPEDIKARDEIAFINAELLKDAYNSK